MSEKPNESRGILWVLGISLGILGLLAVAFFLLNNSPLRSTETAAAPTQESIELWNAYQIARAAAREQAPDAQLVSASTHWREAQEATLLTGNNNWSFVFYSAQSSHLLDVVVTTDGAQVINQTRVWNQPALLEEEGTWRQGPKDALMVFMAYNGHTFLEEHPQAAVDLHLANEEDQRSAWTIVALDIEDRSVMSLLIDANTLEVISTTPS